MSKHEHEAWQIRESEENANEYYCAACGDKVERDDSGLRVEYRTVERPSDDVLKRVQEIVKTSGKVTDLHLYLDVSGFNGLEIHRPLIVALAESAKDLDLTFGFSSFSHYCSDEIQIDISDKTPEEIFQEIACAEIASGGTDFAAVWSDIQTMRFDQNARLNIVLTDFYWSPSVAEAQRTLPHPENLYYASSSNEDLDRTMLVARMFARSMRDFRIEPEIANRILGLPNLTLN